MKNERKIWMLVVIVLILIIIIILRKEDGQPVKSLAQWYKEASAVDGYGATYCANKYEERYELYDEQIRCFQGVIKSGSR